MPSHFAPPSAITVLVTRRVEDLVVSRRKRKRKKNPPNLIMYYSTVLRQISVMVGVLVEAYYRKDSIDRQRVFLEINLLFNS